MTDSEKLEAARRSGSLAAVIGVLREEGMQEPPAPTSVQEQVGLEDAAIRVAAGLATGTKDAQRRTIFRDLQPGMTVTPKGVAKTTLSRAEKMAKTLAWAKGWTQDQRDAYIVSDKFEALTDRQQEIISEVFGQIEDRTYEDSIGIENVDLDAEPVDIDQLPEDETESAGDSFEVQEGEDVESFDDIFERSAWEAETT